MLGLEEAGPGQRVSTGALRGMADYKSHCATGAVAANYRGRRAPTSSLRCMVGFAVRRALRGMGRGDKFSLGLFS